MRKCYFDSYDPSELEQIIKTQQRIINYQTEKHKDLYQHLIVIDDFADDTFFYTKVLIITSIKF